MQEPIIIHGWGDFDTNIIVGVMVPKASVGHRTSDLVREFVQQSNNLPDDTPVVHHGVHSTVGDVPVRMLSSTTTAFIAFLMGKGYKNILHSSDSVTFTD